jgi:hypothetical protein
MILDVFRLLPEWFCYVIVNVQNLKSHMHMADWCVSREIANGTTEPYFAGVTILIDGFLQPIPRRDKLKSLQI